MECRELTDRLIERHLNFDTNLNSQTHQEIDTHLAKCANCRTRRDDIYQKLTKEDNLEAN